MVKYKYKNETVLKEFVGRFLKALAKRKGKQVAKVLAKDPAMKKMLKKSNDLEKDLEDYFKKKRKDDPAFAARMDAIQSI
jgi:hypothetical protein|tara:strand:+ start:163 stop:402 length:240 start_codon:yes stop_codon:yes gene_type:complete